MRFVNYKACRIVKYNEENRICKTVILQVGIYECKSWFLTPEEQNECRTLTNRGFTKTILFQQTWMHDNISDSAITRYTNFIHHRLYSEDYTLEVCNTHSSETRQLQWAALISASVGKSIHKRRLDGNIKIHQTLTVYYTLDVRATTTHHRNGWSFVNCRRSTKCFSNEIKVM